MASDLRWRTGDPGPGRNAATEVTRYEEWHLTWEEGQGYPGLRWMEWLRVRLPVGERRRMPPYDEWLSPCIKHTVWNLKIWYKGENGDRITEGWTLKVLGQLAPNPFLSSSLFWSAGDRGVDPCRLFPRFPAGYWSWMVLKGHWMTGKGEDRAFIPSLCPRWHLQQWDVLGPSSSYHPQLLCVPLQEMLLFFGLPTKATVTSCCCSPMGYLNVPCDTKVTMNPCTNSLHSVLSR